MNNIYIYINRANDLNQIRNLEKNQNATIVFYSDIDCKDLKDFDPIDASTNEIKIEGLNHTMNNLSIKSEKNVIGLFSYAKKLTIKNLIIKNLNISGNETCGGIVGQVYGNLDINNLKLKVSINGESYCGGVCGFASKVDIKNSEIDANISARGVIGGIVGGTYYFNIDNNTHVNPILNSSYSKFTNNTMTDVNCGYLYERHAREIRSMILDYKDRLPVKVSDEEMKILLHLCKRN